MSAPPLPERLIARLPPQVGLDVAAGIYLALHDRWGPHCELSHHAIESITRSIAMLGLLQQLVERSRSAEEAAQARRILRRHETRRRRYVQLLEQWERDRIRHAKQVPATRLSDVG